MFLTADTHFGHQNILRHCNRPFASIEEMDAALIANWNAVVGPQDTVWHLGDFAWKNHLTYKGQLNGKINWVLGNHDKCSVGVQNQFTSVRELYRGRLPVDANRLGPNDRLLLWEPPCTSVPTFLFHYPLVSWPAKSRGTVHFYGHVHGRYSRRGDLALDVGVDVHDFRPILLENAINLAIQNHLKKE